MILSELHKLYQRMTEDDMFCSSLPCQGMSIQKISFEIVIDEFGNLIDILDAKHDKLVGKKSKRVPREIQVLGFAHSSGTKLTPRLLWDSAEYALGFSQKHYLAKKEIEKAERTINDENASNKNKLKAEKEKEKALSIIRGKLDKKAFVKFEAFKQYNIAFMESNAINNEGLKAVCAFLSKWDPYNIPSDLQEKLGSYADYFGVFRLGNHTEYIYEDETIKDTWLKIQGHKKQKLGICLVTGAENVPLTRILDTKIKIYGAPGSGAVISSFNGDAYLSYGKEQTYNSPISEKAGFNICNALNMLLSNNKYNTRIGDTTIVFWSERRTSFDDIIGFILKDKYDVSEAIDPVVAQKIKSFLQMIESGLLTTSDNEFNELNTRFFILGISPNSSRIVIRFWCESTIKKVAEKILKHQKDLKITKMFKTDPDFISNYKIILSAVRVGSDGKPQIPPLLPGQLLRSVMTGTNYPSSIYNSILNRINTNCGRDYIIGKKITYIQASFIKAFLIRNYKQEGAKMSLDLENANPAYLLGRLFATLEKTQDESSGGVNAGIGDRFYSSASSTPRLVFPTILGLFRKWIKKLSSEKKGLAIVREKLVEEILDKLSADDGFPPSLTMEEKGLFALGYYQQMRVFFNGAEKNNQQ